MSSVREFLRRWLGMSEPPVRDGHDVSRSLQSVNRQLTQLRGLLHQQADLTVEALHRAGWQDDEDVAQQEALGRALAAVQADADVLVGPWTGEVGFELLYWIPFLGWLAEQGPGGRRMVVVSRGGTAAWYRHLTSRYVDLLELMSPEEFRTQTAGKKKQYDPRRAFDRDVLSKVRERLGLKDGPVVHPSAMFRLFAALWRRRAAVDLVESFSVFRRLTPPPQSEPAVDLPTDYVVAKFYFSKAFPDTQANRTFVTETLRCVTRQAPVALLSTSVRLDEHSDFDAHANSGLFVVGSHSVPHRNLELQTRLIAGARGFIGTYGGFSYLAPFYGVPSLSFFSRRNGFESHHLDLANRVFDRLLPGGFLALDRRAAHLVEPALGKWGRESFDEDSARVEDPDSVSSSNDSRPHYQKVIP
jgi:hypothetical protein